MKIILSLILFLGLCSNASAFRYKLSLRGGLSQSWGDINGLEGSEDEMHGTGFNTHFGYKWKYFELTLSSYIYWGDIEGLTFKARNETIRGEGSFRHVSFGPVLRYQLRGVQPVKNWFMFVGLGPVWSLQTVKLDTFSSTGPLYNKNQKLTFESTGGTFVMGFEEDLPYKEMHPVFIEFMYSYKKSRKVSVVDASDFTETNILSTEEIGQDLSGHFYMVSIGMLLF